MRCRKSLGPQGTYYNEGKLLYPLIFGVFIDASGSGSVGRWFSRLTNFGKGKGPNKLYVQKSPENVPT